MTINFDALTQFLQDIIRIPSLPGEEGPVVERFIAEMRSLNFDKAYTDINGSAIGIIEGAQPGPTLLLDGHCDIVGVSPGVTWQYDPYGGEIVDGKLYGRGTSDMKGALAAMVYAAAAVDRSKLAGRIVVSASVLEEVMEGVALRTIMDDLEPDFVVIGQSVIPSLCRVSYDRRLLPDESMEGVLHEMQFLPPLKEVGVVIAEGEHQTYTGQTLRGHKFFPAWKFTPDHPFVQASLAGLKAAELNPKLGAFQFCTNGAYSAGIAGVPTIGFGPSEEGLAHVTDEYIEMAQLEGAAKGYLGIIESVLKS